jgi:C-terminal processing protease CtpA/Prc
MRFQRVAQAREADEAMARELEREERELERERVREAEARASEAELEARLDEAQERLEEAARQVAELSSQLAGDAMVMALEGLRSIAPRPMLGINIASTTDAADGVGVVGVTPGGPADEAGLQAGDVLIRVDDVDLTGAGGERAEARLTEFMQAVEDGQAVTVTFLRGGEEQQAVVTPRKMNPLQLAFSMDDNFDFHLGDLDIPEDLGPHALRLRLGHAGPWGDMELVSLSPDLARYFGTEEGLLVVRAPGDAALQLRDGDVILDIDGRKPTSPGHAMRILRSYAAGERLGLRIVRDREPLSLELEMPAETMSLGDPESPALHPSRSLHPSRRGDRVIRIEPEST